MKRYSNLFENICDMQNLIVAHSNASHDKMWYKEVQMVNQNPDFYLKQIQDMLLHRTYLVTKSDYNISIINDKGKERELWKLNYFPHRIIQWAIMLQLEPIFMETLTSAVCASIPKRGGHYAKNKIERWLHNDPEGTKYCLKMDIKKFYPSINRDILKQLLRRKIKCKDTLDLLDKIIDSCDKGVPIGSYLSQYLANFYLTYLDHYIKEELHMKYYLRYMDDMVILSGSKEELHHCLKEIKDYLENILDLTLKKNYQIFPVDDRGVDFVGYVFRHGYTKLRKRTKLRMEKKLTQTLSKAKTTGNINFSEYCCINSYYGWLKHCNSYNLYTKYIEPLEGYTKKYHDLVLKKKKKG
jgi:hypothetical protein